MNEPHSYFEHAKALAVAAAPLPPGEDNLVAHGEPYEMPVSPGARVNCEPTDTQRLDKIVREAAEKVWHIFHPQKRSDVERVIRAAIDAAMQSAEDKA